MKDSRTSRPGTNMQNSLHLDRPAHQAAILRHFGGSDSTIVLSEDPGQAISESTGGAPHP